jgi:nucleoside 2-deoxyribosyltransferase
MKIYLCGGFKSGWQDDVITEVKRLRPDAEVFDPREHMLHDPKDYTHQDLQEILSCDILFAYMESTNPGYANLAFEVGFAIAAFKKVILINEKGGRWAEMMHQKSDVFGDIPGALAALPFMKEFRRD